MLNVNSAAGTSARSPGRTRRGLKHTHSPRIQRKQLKDVTIDNERTALPDNAGGKVPIQQTPFSDVYQVETELGRGKFAVVKKCRHKRNNKDYAAKILRKRRGGRDCRKDIIHEVKMLEMALDHPRLVQLVELFETQHELILVMEHAAGGELFHYIMMEEGFEEKEVVRLMRQVLEALVFLHSRDIVHMDIKPQNLLMTAAPPTGDIKLCDFGFSRTITSQDDVRDIIGTPDYVAPEILSYEPLHTSCDMWSVGVLVYVMLTGCSPFAGDNKMETFSNITQLNLDFPADLFDAISKSAVKFIKRLLKREPEERMTAEESLNHPWVQNIAYNSHAVANNSLRPPPVDDSSLLTSYCSLAMAEVIDSSSDPPDVIGRSITTLSVIDSSVTTPNVNNNSQNTPVSDGSVVTPTDPPLSTPSSSRNSLYMSADSLLEINEKRTSRCLDSSGDELDRSTDNLDQSTDDLDRSTEDLDQSGVNRNRNRVKRDGSLDHSDILKAFRKVNLDNKRKTDCEDFRHSKSSGIFDVEPCDLNTQNSIGCDGHVTRLDCDNLKIAQTLVPHTHKNHSSSQSFRGIESQRSTSPECRDGEHRTHSSCTNEKRSSFTGYYSAQLAQLSIDSIHDIPCVCVQEATLSVHIVNDLDAVNGNDVISENDVTGESDVTSTKSGSLPGEAATKNGVINRCYCSDGIYDAHADTNIRYDSKKTSAEVDLSRQRDRTSKQNYCTAMYMLNKIDLTNDHLNPNNQRFRCESGTTGSFAETGEMDGKSTEEFSSCVVNSDDVVTNLDVIMTSTDVYMTDSDSYVTSIDMSVKETDIYTPVLRQNGASNNNASLDCSFHSNSIDTSGATDLFTTQSFNGNLSHLDQSYSCELGHVGNADQSGEAQLGHSSNGARTSRTVIGKVLTSVKTDKCNVT